MNFDTWMMMCDVHIQQRLGIGSEDLPDQDYCSMYEDGMKPLEAAKEIVQIMKEELEFQFEHCEEDL